MAIAIETAGWKRFVAECLALEPGTENSGTAGTFKAGYHNSRDGLMANPAWHNDYSIRLPDDKLGPSNAGAAFDWTFHDAQRGQYANIMKYMDRIEAAYKARDPRLHGWREALGQADPDLYAEGFDFVGWFTRTPDSTHTWHIHFSKLRRYTTDWPTFAAMLSILRGETLAQWQQGGDGDMTPEEHKMLADMSFAITQIPDPEAPTKRIPLQVWAAKTNAMLAGLGATLAGLGATIAALAEHSTIPPETLDQINEATTRFKELGDKIASAAANLPTHDERVEEARLGANAAEDT